MKVLSFTQNHVTVKGFVWTATQNPTSNKATVLHVPNNPTFSPSESTWTYLQHQTTFCWGPVVNGGALFHSKVLGPRPSSCWSPTRERMTWVGGAFTTDRCLKGAIFPSANTNSAVKQLYRTYISSIQVLFSHFSTTVYLCLCHSVTSCKQRDNQLMPLELWHNRSVAPQDRHSG